jgi:hypothetical protein
VAAGDDFPDLAQELEYRDELLIACRAVLLGVASRHAAALVAQIDALLDLDDERSPASSRQSAARGG